MTSWIIYADSVTTPRRDQAEPTTPRGRRRAETLREIEQAAIEVMAEDGVAALSLTKVAQRVGLKQPSLYQYVTSRVDLYDALFQAAATQHLQVTEKAIAASSPGWPAVRAISTASFEFGVAHPVLAQLLFSPAVPGFTPSADAYAPSVQVMTLTNQHLRIAVDEHQLRKDAATEEGVGLLISLIAGIAVQRAANQPNSGPGPDRFTALMPAALDMYQTYYAPS